jgi:predicted  nucleic acid-binding Zn-ribbon protein
MRVKIQNAELQRETEQLQDQLTASNTNMSNVAMELEALQHKYAALVESRESNGSTTSTSSTSGASDRPSGETKSSTLDESKESDGSGAKLASASGTKGMLHLQQMLDVDRDTVSELRAQLQDARGLLELDGKDLDEFTSKVVNSRQFRQLRKMLDTKNTQLMDLRKRIVQYEPDNTLVS